MQISLVKSSKNIISGRVYKKHSFGSFFFGAAQTSLQITSPLIMSFKSVTQSVLGESGGFSQAALDIIFKTHREHDGGSISLFVTKAQFLDVSKPHAAQSVIQNLQMISP
jgi:hypothetical protein